jgi:hypothetical protein
MFLVINTSNKSEIAVGYSTQYGYKKRTPRGPRGKQPTSRVATSAQVVPENETEGQPIEESNLETQEAPKITFVRPPHGQDRF